MKVEVKENEVEKEIKFPCLMVAEKSDVIILCTGRGHDGYVGTYLSGISNSIGYYSNEWPSGFKPFNGTVTLSND